MTHVESTYQTNSNRYLAQKHVNNKTRELTNTEDQQIKEEHAEKVISQINLSGLTEQRKEAAREMLQEEAESFSVSSRDVENFKDL